MDESRLTNMESAFAFQEKTISDLSDVVCRQQREIDLLTKKLEAVVERLTQDEEESSNEKMLEIEKPPHY